MKLFLIIILTSLTTNLNCQIEEDECNSDKIELVIIDNKVEINRNWNKILKLKINVKNYCSIEKLNIDTNTVIQSNITDYVEFYVKNRTCGICYILHNDQGNFIEQSEPIIDLVDKNGYVTIIKLDKKKLNYKPMKVHIDDAKNVLKKKSSVGLNTTKTEFNIYLYFPIKLMKGSYNLKLLYCDCESIDNRENYWCAQSNSIQVLVK